MNSQQPNSERFPLAEQTETRPRIASEKIFGGATTVEIEHAGQRYLLASPAARFAPVWVDDVANCVVDSLTANESIGKSYNLCGPQQYSLRELVQYASAVSGHPRMVVGLPDAIAWLQAWIMEFLPEPPMTRDNLRSMRVDSVCGEGSKLPFGRKAAALEAIAPGYLAP